jgi:hypothetical protein
MTKRWHLFDNGMDAGDLENPAADSFLAEIAEVCRKHNLSISHEDEHGAFRLRRFNESDLEWLNAAHVDARKIR